MSTYEPADLYRDAAFARRLAAGLVGEAFSEDVWQATGSASRRGSRSWASRPG